MKAYFETVPAELDKSALADGCNRFQAYLRVVVPVSGPGLVAGGAFTFMLCWTTALQPVIAGMNGQINIADEPWHLAPILSGFIEGGTKPLLGQGPACPQAFPQRG